MSTFAGLPKVAMMPSLGFSVDSDSCCTESDDARMQVDARVEGRVVCDCPRDIGTGW